MDMESRSGERYVWSKMFELVQKRWLALLAAVIGFALLGLAIASFLIKPVYQANASLIVNAREVNAASITSEQLNSAEELANLYGVIVKSDSVLEAVIRDLSLDMDFETLVEKVTVSSVNGTSVMKISVRDQDAEFALKILKSIVSISPKIIADTVEAGSVKVVSAPRLQRDPVSPSRLRYTLLGAVIGAVILYAAMLLTVVKEDKIVTKRDVESVLGIRTLGEIPDLSTRKKKSGKWKRKNTQLLSSNSDFAFQESYRYLRMMLNHRLPKGEHRAIVVTSAVAGEGKSYVSINLALSLVADGKKVLLLECDLRKPCICSYLGIEQKPQHGLSEILSGASGLKGSLISKDGLLVLPAGETPDNPTELLGSNTMRRMIEVMKEHYDYVIMDTPPAAGLADALALCSCADGILFVIRQGFADADVIEAAQENLKSSGTELLGAVLNCCKVTESRSGRYGYDYAYGYRGRESH